MNRKSIRKDIDIYALVAAIDTYQAGPGEVAGKEKILKILEIKESWEDIAEAAGEEGYYDT